jgi:methylaspartate ammonia-lyase
METYEFEIYGTIVKITTDKKLNISDVIDSLAKSLNGDDVNVEDCIYKGKKKYYKEIKIN